MRSCTLVGRIEAYFVNEEKIQKSEGQRDSGVLVRILLRKDVLALERVQRRFTRMIPGMKSVTYEERLRTLGLYLMEFRRMRGDLIEAYRILNCLDRVDIRKVFPL
eukprot:g19462.t1